MAVTGEAWKEQYNRLEKALADMPTVGGRITPTPSAVGQVMDFLNTERNVNTQLRVLGALDVDRLSALCSDGGVSWWGVFTARAFAGDLEGLRKVYKASREPGAQEGIKPSPTTALQWLAESYTLPGDYKNNIRPEVIRQLLEWGANPNDDNGKWLEKSLRQLDADCIRELVTRGANPDTVFRVMGELQDAKQYEQAGRIQEALSRKNIYFKLDDQTLLETKYVPDTQGGSSFKTMFNFRARRVTEIYEYGSDRKAVMTSVPFGDYDAEALEDARGKLKEMGGTPREGLAKPRMKGLS